MELCAEYVCATALMVKGEFMEKFILKSEFTPSGDQPEAIQELAKGIENGEKGQILLGVTGSGKTYTIANVIQKVNRPTLVLAHNKTLASQLCAEFKEFFPENAVEFFVSYYDYYQPEAYVPQTDTFIEKDASINDEIDKLRHSATMALFERRDVIVVASVSCIYGLGDPEDYQGMVISIRPKMKYDRDKLIEKLVEMQYERNDINFTRNKFRAHGDVLEVFPSSENEKAIRIEFFDDEIERICEINTITGEILGLRSHVAIYPASHYVTNKDKLKRAISDIRKELAQRLSYFKENGKLLEAQRIEQRTNYDMEMLEEVGFCQGIENYSRHISGRKEGSAPYTLIDYFPEDFLLVIDESHVTIPQLKAMYAGDKSRKDNLVEYGFRLPSAYDNRPLTFSEFEERINQVVYVSATPADYEKEHSEKTVEQVIRPTGLIDPKVEVRKTEGQIDDLVGEINERAEKGERVLVTTLTKKMAEALTDHMQNLGIRVRYMHSEVETIERMEIIRDLRLGVFDVLIGINLLREGLDLPEVSLIAILDADKEGFLRSSTSLIQTIGRAARNAEGKVIMYADSVTEGMRKAIDETERRRKIQSDYNKKHNIVPKTVKKSVRDVIQALKTESEQENKGKNALEVLERQMKEAASQLRFEDAARLRDKINRIKGEIENEK